jgi:hypothetical protein
VWTVAHLLVYFYAVERMGTQSWDSVFLANREREPL